MSNAWYYYVAPLAISAAFVFAGILSLCTYWFGGRDPGGKRRIALTRPIVGAVFGLGVGGSLGIPFLLTSPTPWQREELLDQILRMPPERIERFVVSAGRANQYNPLTRTEVVIEDAAHIRQIAEILRAAPEEFPNHPRSRWTAEVQMVTRDGTYCFGVNATVPGHSNGTLVTPYATPQGGWSLGSVRADGLDHVLEDAVHKARSPD